MTGLGIQRGIKKKCLEAELYKRKLAVVAAIQMKGPGC